MKILVGGVMDLLHYGHINFLKTARSYGDHLTLALNRDEFVYAYKGKYPIMNIKERVAVCEGIRWVDEVIVNEGDENWMNTIARVQPKYIVTSEEWREKDYYKQMGITKDTINSLDIELIYIPYTSEISTTQILERIRK